ncbi:MAG: 3-phosphoshikimate 1-carboxyvinyltransferase [Solirubrobacteraceae bacterium]
MTGAVRVSPGPVARSFTVRVPGSKSLTNRALLLATLAGGRSTLLAPLASDDTEAMAGVARALGCFVGALHGAGAVAVDGLGGAPRGGGRVWCATAGTVARFVLPVLAAGEGRYEVDGDEQLRRRPLRELVDALRAQGAEVDGDALPLTVFGAGLAGGDVLVDASVSSQFLSGLLIAAPLARAPTRLRFDRLVSRPYLALTIEAMRAFGVGVTRESGLLAVTPAPYRAAAYAIEPDASTASYFLAAAALTGATVGLPGLALDHSAQGDLELVGLLQAMGCTIAGRDEPLTLTGPPRLIGIEAQMGDSTDVFMTLACVAPFADGPTTIEGIAHARVKESDRVGATAENLRRLGIEVEEGRDHLRIQPGAPRSARLPTYDDHRIAMAFALVGLRSAVELEEPGVVDKTCPGFWELWRSTGARVQELRS